jgi:hypothetical protein
MCAASSRICFTIANNQPSKHLTDRLDQSADHPQANDSRSIKDLSKATEEHDAVHQLQNSSGYRRCQSQSQADLVDGYTRLITDRVDDGWSCHLVTILFAQLPGPRSAVISRMKDEVQRVYSTLLTRVHRKPRTALADELPVLVGALDLPVYKRNRSSAPKVFCNGGLHIHVLILMPPKSRLNESLADHFQAKQDLYARPGMSIQRIHVRPAEENHGRVVDYVLKTFLNGRLSYDEAILVLPRTHGELYAA